VQRPARDPEAGIKWGDRLPALPLIVRVGTSAGERRGEGARRDACKLIYEVRDRHAPTLHEKTKSNYYSKLLDDAIGGTQKTNGRSSPWDRVVRACTFFVGCKERGCRKPSGRETNDALSQVLMGNFGGGDGASRIEGVHDRRRGEGCTRRRARNAGRSISNCFTLIPIANFTRVSKLDQGSKTARGFIPLIFAHLPRELIERRAQGLQQVVVA
jgi:hypothetical protein